MMYFAYRIRALMQHASHGRLCAHFAMLDIGDEE